MYVFYSGRCVNRCPMRSAPSCPLKLAGHASTLTFLSSTSLLYPLLKLGECNTFSLRQEPETKCSTLSNQVCSMVRNCGNRDSVTHNQVTDTICKQVPNAVCKPVKKQKCENVPVVTCRWSNVSSSSLYPLHTVLVQVFISTGKNPSPSVKLCPTKSVSW